jgi:two-component sensor histidine kinase
MNEESPDLAEQLKEARDREFLLRGELQHRVRNMLAIIRSIFSRTVDSGGSLEDVADHFRGRLDAVAQLQSLYAMQAPAAADFEQMIRDELQPFQFGDDPRISINGPDIRLDLDVAQLMGLALHELTTNSIKFGALSGDNESGLAIRWSSTGQMMRFEWLETGVPVIAPAPLHRGFGREFIEQALPYQLGATTSFVLRPGGVFCSIALPIGPAAGRVRTATI